MFRLSLRPLYHYNRQRGHGRSHGIHRNSLDQRYNSHRLYIRQSIYVSFSLHGLGSSCRLHCLSGRYYGYDNFQRRPSVLDIQPADNLLSAGNRQNPVRRSVFHCCCNWWWRSDCDAANQAGQRVRGRCYSRMFRLRWQRTDSRLCSCLGHYSLDRCQWRIGIRRSFSFDSMSGEHQSSQ
eukprot:10768_1